MLASFKDGIFCRADTALDLFLQDFLSEWAAFGDCFLSSSLSSSPPSPRSYICFHFSACMTNSKEIPNCGRPKPAAPPSAFSWQKTSCLTFNGECFARQLGLGEIQRGNSGNLIGWAVQRTVKPLHKEGARTALELLQKHNRVLLFFSGIPQGECGTCREKKAPGSIRSTFHGRFNWTDGNNKCQKHCMMPLRLVSPQRVKKYKHCQDMCDLLKASTLKLPYWPAPTIARGSLLIHIPSNCILKENALRGLIMEWHMNRIISTESLQGHEECRTLYLTALRRTFPTI